MIYSSTVGITEKYAWLRMKKQSLGPKATRFVRREEQKGQNERE